MSKDYTSIPGLGAGRGSFQVAIRSRLYRGQDHLLLVQSTGYTEDYKRVFYRDIRYIVARENHRFAQINLIFGLLLLVFLLIPLTGTPWLYLVFGDILWAICLTVNLARGSSCHCYVVTNVQTLLLPTPRRMKKVPALIEFLKTTVLSPEGETAST